MVTNFSIKTPIFEGPLELLIDLVERRKLLINDFSLATVTDEYMAEVSKMQEMSLPGTANFVALAATLLLIKSKSLLPVLELSEEEESSIEELEERLKLYQIYRVASATVAETFGQRVMHERQYVPERKPLFLPDEFCSKAALHEAMYRVVSDLPIKIVKPKVQVRKVVSLEEMIDRLHKRIESQLRLKFSELIADSTEKHTYIVGFLAVLESVKQGSILVTQIQRFEEIEIEHSQPKVPSYK
ncbi:segregation/condensation protein A [Candidatus Nomurabacteria bacterium]|nr:segregation/condensation protein A [Candidatus Nomurabacteria bacterium]